jgi:hypothetical protein
MLEEYIKNLEFPLVAFYSIIMNKNIDDINKSIFVKIFINNHMDIVVEHNLLYFNLIDYPITYNTIYDTYHIISRQQSIVPYLAKFKKSYNNMFFWKQPIDKQIKYLQNIHLKFLSYFDASKSLLYYHVKLKQITENINGMVSGFHIEDMVDRLKKTYDLFKYTFFKENNIILISMYEFVDLSFKNQIKYVEYIFNKINIIMKQTITYFELYDNYRHQLISILSDNNMIDITYSSEIDSDIDINDMEFINRTLSN